ncbi:MAG: penicillin-binding protein activator LpoB [Phycisphaerae bacterium]|nr:penicillin-binding protein activator LpoB [Phycisphaerae bacterium]
MRKILLLFLIAIACAAGCQKTEYSQSYGNTVSPDADDQLGGTGIESADIRTVAIKMATSILDTPEIMNADGMPRIALLPVKNNTRFVISKDIFTQKIRIELNRNAQGKVRFLARDRMEDILQERDDKREGLTSANKIVSVMGADFFLTGELTGLAKASGGNRSDYILMSFQLIDTETSDIIWEDAYEIKRVGVTGTVYQ